MDYSGEYYISPEDYENIIKKIVRNKTNTSWLIFPNGIKNKVYLEKTYKQILYILYPLDKNKKLILKQNILNCYPQRLVMYSSLLTENQLNAEMEEHFDNYEPHDF